MLCPPLLPHPLSEKDKKTIWNGGIKDYPWKSPCTLKNQVNFFPFREIEHKPLFRFWNPDSQIAAKVKPHRHYVLHQPWWDANKSADKSTKAGFPGGAVVENLPANAGDTGSSPGLGRSHMRRSDWARELQLLSLRVWSLCSATREAAIVRGPRTAMKSGPRSPQLEKALAQKWRSNIAINQ